jgi:ATP-dependent helicase/nuclease subunit B
MPVRRHFLPWDQPLLPQVVKFLRGDWSGTGPLDLASVVVVVPTKQAGRRLREALAAHASASGQAVFPPRVLTPEALIAPVPGSASRLESLLAWARTLQAADFAHCRDVFPTDPPAQSLSWGLRVADQLLSVQATLAEAGLRLADVSGRAGEGLPETARWLQLGELERAYDARLQERGLRDAQADKIASSRQAPAAAVRERLVVVGAPDPMPLALAALEARAAVQPVDILVFAPADAAAAFDGWGRPLAASWQNRILDLADFDARVRLCADPPEQAEEIAMLAEAYRPPEGLLAIGVADLELAPALESALLRRGFETFNPEGRPRWQDALYHLAAALAELAREPIFEAVESLGRSPAILDFLSSRLGAEFSAARWLEGLDELRARHLPADLAGARQQAAELERFPLLAPALAEIEILRAGLAGPVFTAAATAPLQAIYAGRQLQLAHPADARLGEGAEAWASLVAQCGAAAADLPAADCWELALRLFREGMVADEKPAGALELQGWLELLWEDAPHLVVGGMNDGSVPDAIAGDAFLPESLREKLGLKTNADRLARDAYLLQALASSRAGAGRLDLLFGKASAAGDPLRPSRLLLRCADADLPARVDALFRPLQPSGAPLAWTRAWRLKPPADTAVPSRVAVTALRDWLTCPFRFYLRHVLDLRPFDAAKSELDDLDFGTLCHAALEAMGRRPELRECADPVRLREFLSAELDRRIRARFGENLTVPLVVQREAARQRLGQAAAVQARECEAGWRIIDVERKIGLQIEGLQVSGKIDRIDRHLETGAIRVLDYKTSDTAKAPREVHLRVPRSDETPLPETVYAGESKPRVWADLQLPFYRESLAGEFPGPIACGYFNLPKASGETRLALWEDDSPDLRTSAASCAAAVCRAIRAGEFWPPNEDIRAEYDDFATLFHHGARASVAWPEDLP